MTKFQRMLQEEVEKSPSLRQAAAKLHVTVTGYHDWLTTGKIPLSTTLKRIADYWELPMDVLLMEDGVAADTLAEIYGECKKLSLDDQHHLLRKLKGGNWR